MPGVYMMDLETTCHVSRVMCHMSLFNLSQTIRPRALQFSHNIHHNLCVMCSVSHVRWHMSFAMCHMSHVLCHIFLFLQIIGVSGWRLSYQQGEPLFSFLFLLLFLLLIKNVLIPNIYFSRIVVDCFRSLKSKLIRYIGRA